MDNHPYTGVRFAIAPLGDSWAWEAFDLDGQLINRGEAKSKREAAAFVIRETLRNCTPMAPAFEEMRVAA